MAGCEGQEAAVFHPYDVWLHEGSEDLLKPYAGDMEAYPVSNQVNNPRNQGESLIQPL